MRVTVKILVLSLILLTPSVFAIQLGDKIDLVLEELGKPTGKMVFGDTTYLYYPTISIKASRGIITSLETKTEAEVNKELEAIKPKRKNPVAVKTADTIIEEALSEEVLKGLEVKNEILSSTKYILASAAERVAIWKNFKRSYPNVDFRKEWKRDVAEMKYEQALSAKKTKQRERDTLLVRYESSPVYYAQSSYCPPRKNYVVKKSIPAPRVVNTNPPFCGTPNKVRSSTRHTDFTAPRRSGISGSYTGNGLRIGFGTGSTMSQSAVGTGSSFCW